MRLVPVAACLVALSLGACSSPTTAPAAVALQVTPWALPAPDGGAQPDLVAAPDGTLLLSWMEAEGGGHALRFARHDAAGWSAPRTIARGGDWFVNWADTPHVTATADGALWAQWLRKTADAAYAYDVVLSRSGDGGATWSAPVAVNDDGTPTEHGFASLWPAGAGRIGVAWLDGRATAAGDGGHGGHGGGAMTLRAAFFDQALARSGETQVDASTCDCCQTDVALARGTPLLAYRGRTPGEVRDILLVRLVEGGWTAPRPVHADGWRIPACPVNGPALATQRDAVVVAWYTAASGTPTVRVARSGDGGAGFSPPRALDAGETVLGRVAVGMDAEAAWVAWLAESGGTQRLRLARIAHGDRDTTFGDATVVVTDVATVAGRGRATGFPQLAMAEGRVHLAWTEVVDGRPRLRGATVAAR